MIFNKRVFLIVLLFNFSLLVLGQVNLQQGLVAYYPFNGNANDESGNGNTGTVYGAALTTDRFGNEGCAYYFDGNSRIEIADNDNLDLASKFTISIFINQFSFFNYGYRLVDKNSAGFNDGYTFDTYDNNNGNSMRLCGAGSCRSVAPHTLNNWHHLVVTFQVGITRFFLDGTIVGSEIYNDTSLNSNDLPLFIGHCNNGNNALCRGENFYGILDEICIFNRALNYQEIQALYYENQPPQTNTITNILINPHSDGSGLVDVNFDLSGTANLYSISLEASFDGGISYTPIQDSFLSGDIGPIEPSINKHIVWDGVESFPNIYSTQTKLKIVASQLGAPCAGMPTITDIDGNIYNTVQIGSQCWMKENLNIGTRIAGSTSQTDNGVIEKYCYDDDESNCDIYGGLYQWDEMMQYSAIEGTQGICTEGWHLPTEAEWATLISYLLGFQVAGGKMKTTGTLEAGTGLWYSPNTGATNNSGFAGLPSGWRRSNGEPLFEYQGNIGHLWSSSMRYDYGVIQQLANSVATSSWAYSWKSGGLPVRCLKDN